MPPKATGVVGQVMRPPMAAFDFDHTLVVPKEGRQFPRNAADWQWLRPSVPDVVRNYAKTHNIVIVTDQSKAFKLDQIREVVKTLGVPITVVIGNNKGPDDQKKPGTRLFYESLGTGTPGCDSFFVGDAAGRPGDWADKDAQFAKAIGVEFIVPEDIFPMAPRAAPSPASKPKVATPPTQREMVLMVGYPGGGKSTYIASHFPDYTVIEGDVHKTPAKMLKAAAASVTSEPVPGMTAASQSIVFDATNPTAAGRAAFIAFAKANNYPMRCVWIKTSYEVARDRNNQRAAETGVKVPPIALAMFRKRFEEPTAAEGCEVTVVEE